MVKKILSTFIFMLVAPAVLAQDASKLVVPCAIPFYRELDFTVGEWQVFNKSTGKLAGYDRIGRILRGCAIQQSWVSLDDHFSSEYVPFRMSGRSTTAFNGTEWVQLWVDNQAGVQFLKGGPADDKFILRSDNIGGYEYRLTWQRQDDGTLLNVHHRRKVTDEKTADWETLYEWIYVKNLNQNMEPDEDE